MPFAGWELPVRYTDIIQEHKMVRSAGGLFDVSHMGEIFLNGPEARRALNYLTCNDLNVLEPWKAQYNAITNERGGIVDDIIVYMYSPERYMICVNASNTDKDFRWLCEHNDFDCRFENVSAHFGQIAVQGPKACELMETLCPKLRETGLKRFHFMEAEVDGTLATLARTGYTGEDGFEMFVAWDKTAALWDVLVAKGASFGIAPAGLGARDSLRLEACYPLFGHELREDVSAIESGLGWIVKPAKGDFIGRAPLVEQIEKGAARSLTAFEVMDSGIVREGAPLFSVEGEKIGEVTSGSKTPSLERPAGMALVQSDFAKPGTMVEAEVRSRRLRCRIVPRPLYKR